MAFVTDMTLGLYRKVYSGFLTGRKINAVSWKAEAWFWRLHAVADDLGNLPRDLQILRSLAAPLREISHDEIDFMTNELEQVGLIERYEAAGETYLSICDFIERQPAGKNGKRIQRYPAREDGQSRVNPGESKIIQIDPVQSGKSGPPMPMPMPTTKTTTTTTKPARAPKARAKAGTGRSVVEEEVFQIAAQAGIGVADEVARSGVTPKDLRALLRLKTTDDLHNGYAVTQARRVAAGLPIAWPDGQRPEDEEERAERIRREVDEYNAMMGGSNGRPR